MAEMAAKGKIPYIPNVQSSEKQIKIGLGQSYTPPSETMGDRVIQVLNEAKDYDTGVWAAIVSSCMGLLAGAVMLIAGIYRM